MRNINRRNDIWSKLDQPWDIVVIGGGITGAGVLREASRLGARALLVEQRDFAWGSSSRSSKLVHGGLRYLKEGKIGLTRASVQERDRLLEQGQGLIAPLGFLLASYAGDRTGRWTYRAALSMYDLLALRWSHQSYGAQEFQMLAPRIVQQGLQGGFGYGEAQTDDTRLVLRVIREAVAAGGVAINYVAAEELLRADGQVAGVRLRDHEGRTAEARAGVVVNATGAWADRLRGQVDRPARIRPLRGSHMIFPAWRLPVAQGINFMHPLDHRPVFILPWEGVTLVGTTDVDHSGSLDDEPAISPEEVSYLMAAIQALVPSLDLSLSDVISTFAGVRPVIGSGKADPSKEARDHIVWQENGLLTVTGGKLTTFRLAALDALAAARGKLPNLPPPSHDTPALNAVGADLPGAERLDDERRWRLLGRYGADAPALVAAARPGELEPIPGTETLWAELRWAARAEGVVHLEDLLLRRTRLGLLLSGGGESLLPAIRAICQPELSWDDARWEAETAAYLSVWRSSYSLPDPASIPDWRTPPVPTNSVHRTGGGGAGARLVLVGGLIGSIALAVALARRRRRQAAHQVGE
jgi:glycerol-3-phosphate dehydrogenase